MKKILIALILLTAPLKCFALEDYLIISDSVIKSVQVENNAVISAVPIFTIDNSKKVIYVKGLSKGKTKLNILFDDKKEVVEADVQDDKINFSQNGSFEYVMLDLPNEDDYVEILPPPSIRGGK